MSIKKFFSLLIFSVTVTFGISLSVGSLLASWTAPTQTPPNQNIPAAINTGSTGQSKQGGLILNTAGMTNGLIVQYGNVGIGTTSPADKLEVAGNIRFSTTGNYLTWDGGDGDRIVFYKGRTASNKISTESGYTTAFYAGDTQDTSGDFGNFSFMTSDNGVWTSRMKINNSGNVGIGTTNPYGKLHIIGGNTLASGVNVSTSDFAYNSAGTSLGLRLGAATGNTYGVLEVGSGASSTGKLLLNPTGGNVGIGKTDPQSTLDVNGNIIASNPTANNHVATKAYVDTAVSAAGGGSCSDSVQEGTWFSQGGEPRYCQKRIIDASGVATITTINEGLTCKSGNGFCQNGTCSSGAIVFYPISSGGFMSGRSGADASCLSSKPAGLTCSKVHAFLSINGDDEIRDMPTNYGYSTDKVVAWYKTSTGVFTKFGNNWADILDGSILVSAYTGLGNGSMAWTGSTVDGQYSGYNCAGYTASDYAYMSTIGYGQMTNYQWIAYSSTTGSYNHCNYTNYMYCVCE